MAYLNALLVLLGTLTMLAGIVGFGGLGTAAEVAGFLALLAGLALIVLTWRVANLVDRQNDREERRSVPPAVKGDKDREGRPTKNLWRWWQSWRSPDRLPPGPKTPATITGSFKGLRSPG